MPLDRNSAHSAAEVLQRLLPDVTHRDAALRFLAKAIHRAHDLVPEGWSVTLDERFVRLNVGRIETMTLRLGLVHLVLVAGEGTHGIEAIPGVVLNPKGRTTYPSVPGSQACDIPAQQFPAFAARVGASHERLMEKAAASARSAIWAGAHSPGVLKYLEQTLGISLPVPGFLSTDLPGEEPEIGRIYSWGEVVSKWGGEQTFLGKRHGRIVCATLDRSTNPGAPETMVVGNKPKNARRGEELCQQGGPIRVFLKSVRNEWNYQGRFEVEGFTTEPAVLRHHVNPFSGPLARVIFLRRSGVQGEPETLPDVDPAAPWAKEGNPRWILHLRRDRSARLVVAKKDAVRRNSGRLVCEACGFDFADFYGPEMVDFCEVHHRIPVAALEEGDITRLEDLAVLCSNCHRAIHFLNPMPTVEALRDTIHERRDRRGGSPRRE